MWDLTFSETAVYYAFSKLGHYLIWNICIIHKTPSDIFNCCNEIIHIQQNNELQGRHLELESIFDVFHSSVINWVSRKFIIYILWWSSCCSVINFLCCVLFVVVCLSSFFVFHYSVASCFFLLLSLNIPLESFASLLKKSNLNLKMMLTFWNVFSYLGQNAPFSFDILTMLINAIPKKH